MSEIITDVEMQYEEPAHRYYWTPAKPVYSEPWRPTEEEWQRLTGRVAPCLCGQWHPTSYFTIEYLKQFVGLLILEKPPADDIWMQYLNRRGGYNHPW